MLALSWACLTTALAKAHVRKTDEIVINDGRLRVQALSPTLLRVEPMGPMGFEDRHTFAVVNRSFSGVPIWIESENDMETVLSTSYYKIYLQRNVGVYWYVTDTAGVKIYEAIDDLAQSNFGTGFHSKPNLVHWPSPLSRPSYALVDAPRFVAPDWGPTPGPQDSIDPALRQSNGFDFRNNVDGDTYVFLLGKTLEDWTASRMEFLKLMGPCPLLPDYAYGTWFTRWHNYTQKEAIAEVEKWDDLSLPLDVWGLDMNWRNTSSMRNSEKDVSVQNSDGSDWYYDRPNTVLFPNFTGWLSYLKGRGLRTYFNDHPYPVAARGAGGLQTSPEEVSFRWKGLSKWLAEGITLWWFDRNWRFSIPPPFVNTSRTGASWEGLDNAAWGSYVYYKTAEVFGLSLPNNQRSRPLALTKFAPPDWKSGQDSLGHQEHPAHHRFPVWWTGDGVSLQASVETMVDAGIHDFKPFVHSDCGGDYRSSGGDLLRWTAHCAFGTILRFHGADHTPWSYDDKVTSVIRKYLHARRKLAPTLVQAGRRATSTGFPLAARGDLYWPELAPASASNHQYLFLEDLLVAPIWNTTNNMTARVVWVPPGQWEDVWDGSVVEGPRNLAVIQPFERQPMWYRRDGGFFVLAHESMLRVEEQDWSLLVLEAFPASFDQTIKRTVFDKISGNRTELILKTSQQDGNVVVELDIGVAESGDERAWVLRVHLLPGHRAIDTRMDGVLFPSSELHLEPVGESATAAFPFSGAGSHPQSRAGPVVELYLPSSARARSARMVIEGSHNSVLSKSQFAVYV
eukprot:TRINITY_DN4720_c0_g1_i1.p1 TRINITY_DN4720_c0_g1~~TRINITY_DN4720_c0_g1_i1.p1  ORF type:complete len:830 (+),score=68.35 TRINITY_DN4720_c0_g1_i1:117-2492(+)